MLLDFLSTASWKIQDIDFPGFIKWDFLKELHSKFNSKWLKWQTKKSKTSCTKTVKDQMETATQGTHY